jgi:hypothetical protein
MQKLVFRPSVDLHDLLLITRHCIEQRENLTKQRARLRALQKKLQAAQSRLLPNVNTSEPVLRIQRLRTVSVVVSTAMSFEITSQMLQQNEQSSR